jgi:hypothetical protein
MRKFIVISIVLLMLAGFAITSSAQAIEVAVDIKPQSCPNPLNVKGKGVLPVAILGTAGFDVTLIDPSTIMLQGVPLLRWAIEDVATPLVDGEPSCFNCIEEGPLDGYLDLTLKFDKQAVVEVIGEVEDGECVLLELTGELFDGTPIAGMDAILIKDK